MNNNIQPLVTDHKPKWSQLFEVTHIGEYIKKPELLNLSMTCKYYRYRLNPLIFKKLTIIKEGIILPFNRNSKATYKHKLEILIKRLRFDLKGVCHLVQVLGICDGFSKEFFIQLINLFSNIRIFKVYSQNYRYDLINLIDVLSKLKNLRGVELSAGYYNYPHSKNNEIISFFKSLNSLKFLRNGHSIPKDSPFLQIDKSFSKLNTVTIYDDRVLASLQVNLPNLKQFELPNYKMNEHLLLNFLKLNPQLNQMICKWIQIDFIARAWFIPLNTTRKLVEYKDQNYYNLFLKILELYNIKYLLLEYFQSGRLLINIVKINKVGKEVELYSEYSSIIKEVNWKKLQSYQDVLIMKYTYFHFYEIDFYPINCPYDQINSNFIIN